MQRTGYMSKEELSFRDRPINLDETGNRKWVYAKKPSGKWYRRRTVFSWVALLFLVVVPFIRLDGNPVFLIDIINRRFILAGVIFWAQDTFIMALLMLSFVLFIVLFTVTFGRIWCGWACPQTLFLEMIFRKIEYLIEGDYKKRYHLDKGSWTREKILKKLAKHLVFILISIAITNVVLWWFMGTGRWFVMVREPIGENLGGFLVMIAVSAVIYWIYSWFREQVCTMVCPYGRLQGVLLDSKSIVVTYDYQRGEPRGAKNSGDCIDCRQCVSVCPTGIDIRDGTQLECINCTACIDQCNKIMQLTGKPEGLIRYDSENGIREGHASVWNARNRAYSVVLILIFSLFIYTLFSRPKIETTILRTPGLLFQENPDSSVSNVYNINIINKTHEEMALELRLLSHKGRIRMAGNNMVVKDQGRFESTFILYIPRDELDRDKTDVIFGIFRNDEPIEKVKATFVGP